MGTIPDVCPDCGNLLYPPQSLRPAPRRSVPALVLLLIGQLWTLGLLLAGPLILGEVLQEAFGIRVGIDSLVYFFPLALLPAVGLGYLAFRLPLVRYCRCRECGWKAQFDHQPLPLEKYVEAEPVDQVASTTSDQRFTAS